MLSEDYSSKRGYFLLILGVLLGFTMVFSGLVERWGAEPLPEGIVAQIGEQVVTRVEYEETLEMLASDKRDPLTQQDREHVLNRIVDEKLLIQRGLELGLVESDRDVRKTLTSAMMQAIIAEAVSEDISDRELKEFYKTNMGFFLPPPALQVVRLKFSGSDAKARAQEATQLLSQGELVFDVKSRLADKDIVPVPGVLLPLSKLREYIGPEAAEACMTLSVSDFTEPLKIGEAQNIYYLVDKRELAPPEFESVKDQVVSVYRRKVEDQALRDYLERLRKRADVQTFL